MPRKIMERPLVSLEKENNVFSSLLWAFTLGYILYVLQKTEFLALQFAKFFLEGHKIMGIALPPSWTLVKSQEHKGRYLPTNIFRYVVILATVQQQTSIDIISFMCVFVLFLPVNIHKITVCLKAFLCWPDLY